MYPQFGVPKIDHSMFVEFYNFVSHNCNTYSTCTYTNHMTKKAKACCAWTTVGEDAVFAIRASSVASRGGSHALHTGTSISVCSYIHSERTS